MHPVFLMKKSADYSADFFAQGKRKEKKGKGFMKSAFAA